MAFGQVEGAAGLEEESDDLRPAADIRQPVDRTPGDVDEVERRRLVDRRGSIVQVGLDEPRSPGQPESSARRRAALIASGGEVEPHHLRAELRQRQGITPEMALQMQDA